MRKSKSRLRARFVDAGVCADSSGVSGGDGFTSTVLSAETIAHNCTRSIVTSSAFDSVSQNFTLKKV